MIGSNILPQRGKALFPPTDRDISIADQQCRQPPGIGKIDPAPCATCRSGLLFFFIGQHRCQQFVGHKQPVAPGAGLGAKHRFRHFAEGAGITCHQPFQQVKVPTRCCTQRGHLFTQLAPGCGNRCPEILQPLLFFAQFIQNGFKLLSGGKQFSRVFVVCFLQGFQTLPITVKGLSGRQVLVSIFKRGAVLLIHGLGIFNGSGRLQR